jgi:hypothetical protein
MAATVVTNCPLQGSGEGNLCRLYVAYEFSSALPRFRFGDRREIRASRGFERYFR